MGKLNVAYGILQKIRVTWRLRKLDISSTGFEKDIPFVELADGLRFYGLRTGKKDRKYHALLSGPIRKRIPFTHYKVAMDIVIRYIEGGLMLGGPKKEMFYQVKAGDVAVEMGAYMGYYTLYLAQKVGKEGRVIAIEPMEDNLKLLKRNIDYNGFAQVEIVERGVWKSNDTLAFFRNKSDTQSASLKLETGEKEELSVEVRTLDHILSQCKVEQADFMVIQMNGVEPEALEGLNIVVPSNLAIAARYRVDGRDPVRIIKERLIERGYRVMVRSRKFIYGQYAAR